MDIKCYANMFPSIALAIDLAKHIDQIERTIKELGCISRKELQRIASDAYTNNIMEKLVRAGVIKEEVRQEEWISKRKTINGRSFDFQTKDNKLVVVSNANYKTTILENATVNIYNGTILIEGNVTFQVKRKYYTWVGY